MSTTATPAQVARDKLLGFHGQLIGPEDSNYEEARKVYNAMIERRPALIARCANTEDVAAAVRFLASPQADFISGHVLVVDGGLTA